MNYVVGFYFTSDLTGVYLINKKRPEFQHNKLNGIGGKIEPGETPEAAMRREALEEGGCDVEWKYFSTIELPNSEQLNVFYAVGDQHFRTKTDEIVMLLSAKKVMDNAISFETNDGTITLLQGISKIVTDCLVHEYTARSLKNDSTINRANLPDWGNWIARNKDGGVFVFESLPSQGISEWFPMTREFKKIDIEHLPDLPWDQTCIKVDKYTF